MLLVFKQTVLKFKISSKIQNIDLISSKMIKWYLLLSSLPFSAHLGALFPQREM